VPPFLHYFLGNAHGAVAPDDQQPIQAIVPRALQHCLGDVKDFDSPIGADFIMKRVGPIGAAQHRATPRQQPAHVREVQQARFVRRDEPLKAIFDAQDLPSVLVDGRLHRGADDGIETRTIPTTRQNPHTLNRVGHGSDLPSASPRCSCASASVWARVSHTCCMLTHSNLCASAPEHCKTL
jgi:hypothetical protein